MHGDKVESNSYTDTDADELLSVVFAILIYFLETKKHCADLISLASFGVPQLAENLKNSAMLRKRMTVFYSGHVQGVGFRYSVRTVATGFEVNGTVRNLPDGRVELVAEGARDELEAFRQGIRDAGLDGFIRHEDARWAEARSEFRGFEIVR